MSSPRIHLICNAHLDPIWQWSWEEGLTETLATFEVAADLLDKYPEFVFNHNESLLYEWVRDYRPALFKRIQKWVKAGRWIISGGWYVQPDCNLPSGESFVRQALMGRLFFKKHFGVMPKVAYNLDPFGHHGNLPQMLRKTGFETYVHFRPGPAECPIDDFAYRWRGVDGSEVPALRPPCGWYNTMAPPQVTDKINAMLALLQEKGVDVTLFWGAGDHGGGATRADLNLIRTWQKQRPEIVHGSLEEYAQRHLKRLAANGPLKEGELQKCFTGCYTSVIGTKQRNRRGEGLALAAERYAALAWWLLGKPYPAEKIERVWKRILFNQFHDILPGSSVRPGFQGSIEMYGHAFTEARELLLESHLALLQRRKKRAPMPLCIFNPIGERRRRPVEVEFIGATHPHLLTGKSFRVLDGKGRNVPFQKVAPISYIGDWQQRIILDADLPAMGMAEYRLDLVEGPLPKAKAGIRATRKGQQTAFATPFYTLTMNMRTGHIDSLATRPAGGGRVKELIRKGAGALILRDDIVDAWGGGQPHYGKTVGKFACPSKTDLADAIGAYDSPCDGPVRIIEEGPLATRIEVIQTYKRSVARIRYTLYAAHPEIGVELLLNWCERKRALQWAFPTTLDGDQYVTEIPHAAIERPVGNGEEPCGRWTALLSSDAATAFALVNDGPGGVDVRKGELRQSLVRSALFGSGGSSVPFDRLSEHMDLGEHMYKFFLRFGDAQNVRADLPSLAADLTMPPAAYIHIPIGATDVDGLAAGTDTVRVEGDNVHLAALKQSEDGKALIVRLVETAGGKTRATLYAPGLKGAAALAFTRYEIKTVRITRQKGACSWVECDLLERPLR